MVQRWQSLRCLLPVYDTMGKIARAEDSIKNFQLYGWKFLKRGHVSFFCTAICAMISKSKIVTVHSGRPQIIYCLRSLLFFYTTAVLNSYAKSKEGNNHANTT